MLHGVAVLLLLPYYRPTAAHSLDQFAQLWSPLVKHRGWPKHAGTAPGTTHMHTVVFRTVVLWLHCLGLLQLSDGTRACM